MYRERCRPKYSDAELEEIYSQPWQMQDDWEDHRQRLDFTLRVAKQVVAAEYTTAADLSCGDAYWRQKFPQLDWTLGDYAEGYNFRGPIEETIEQIDPVDVFFCCETIEHLDDPDYVLQRIRLKTKRLVLSTPFKHEEDVNPEHYWSWDSEAVDEMLKMAGFESFMYMETKHQPGYIFQIWGCR